jgi:hypothetical protein
MADDRLSPDERRLFEELVADIDEVQELGSELGAQIS